MELLNFLQHPVFTRGAVFYNNDVGNYCVPFLGSDKSVIMRTQRYNYDVKGQEPVSGRI